MELADTSAWTTRHRAPAVAVDFDARVLAEEIATCRPVELELLWTARSRAEFEEMRSDLEALPMLDVDHETWVRAIDVWERLVAQGRHRQVKAADLVIAAVAERAGVAVCHYDADFDVIASVTGQPVRAIAPLGSL
jgi:predicted nucleic acid-binding protein